MDIQNAMFLFASPDDCDFDEFLEEWCCCCPYFSDDCVCECPCIEACPLYE